MRTYEGIAKLPAFHRPNTVCLGVFDGLHRGHRRVIEKAKARARELKTGLAAVTMFPHPHVILKPDQAPALIFNLHHRLRHLSDEGIRHCLVLPFDRRLSKMRPEDFVEKVLMRKLRAKSLCIGQDFRFGDRGRGNMALLREYEKRGAFEVNAVDPAKDGRRVISSTRIRSLIQRGRLRDASRLTGREISLFGTVVHGVGRGKKLGFPTINLDLHHETLPPKGIYAATVRAGRFSYKSAVHIGPRPTFGEKETTIEAFLLKCNKNLYGREVEIFLLKKLRQIKKYASQKDLVSQIKKDVKQVKGIA